MPRLLAATALLDCLRGERPASFPAYAVEELRRVQTEIHSRSLGAELGRELLGRGYDPPGDAAPPWASRDQWRAHRYYSDLHTALWQGFEHEDPDHLLTFLEINPIFFRSGYAKPKMVQTLRRAALTEAQRARAAAIVRHAVLGGKEVSLPDWNRLADVLPHEDLAAIAREALAAEREDVRRKAALLVLRREEPRLLRSWQSYLPDGGGRSFSPDWFSPDWTPLVAWARESLESDDRLPAPSVSSGRPIP